jgi:hypothetical protein
MAAQVLDQHGEAAALAEFLHTKASREMEGAALAVFTFYPDAAAHQLNQMLADGQAKSGTAVFTGRTPIRLNKGAENSCETPFRYSDTGILNFKTEYD